MQKPSGILVSVYRNPKFGDCTNGGISSKFDTFVLLLPEGGPFQPDEKTPALKLVNCRPYFYAIEADVNVDRGFSGQMMGGNFVYSCDSRFPKPPGFHNSLPIPIHDRRENERC